MKRRLQTIIRVLEHAAGYTTIDELARATSAGARTIHRDLDMLERILGYRNLHLERRRGYGVMLLDPLPEHFTQKYLFETLENQLPNAEQRPILLLLYLLIYEDWAKLSQLALDFHLSDSSVASDLSALESTLPDTMVLERQKGVGVRLIADERLSRSLFIQALPEVFPPHRISSLIKSGGARRGAGHWLFRLLPGERYLPAIHRVVNSGKAMLGLSFSPQHELLLDAYLLLIIRQGSNGNNRLSPEEDGHYGMPIPPLYQDGARSMIAELIDELPADERWKENLTNPAEAQLLARILAGLEPSGTIGTDSRILLGDSYPQVKSALEQTLVQLEQRHQLWLHDDHRLIEYLRVSITTALRRLDLRPYPAPSVFSHHPWETNQGSAGELLIHFCMDIFSDKISHLTPELLAHEAEEAVLALEAGMELKTRQASSALSVKVLCYEGLGMSSYIASLAKSVLPAGSIIDTAWEPYFFEHSDSANAYHLLITTFPAREAGIPHLVVNPQHDRQVIADQIAQAAADLKAQGEGGNLNKSSSAGGTGRSAVSISTLMRVLDDFILAPFEPGRPEIDQAVRLLSRYCEDDDQLRSDLLRRESYGSLVFDEYNIRLLHCRSNAVNRPLAGVIQSFAPSQPSLLIMAAPASAKNDETRVLSEIVIALSEDPRFPEILARGSLEEIQGRLFAHFGHLMDN